MKKTNKEICKKCRENKSWWNKWDEERWKNGYIVCPNGKKISKNDKVDWCKYKLERILVEENGNT